MFHVLLDQDLMGVDKAAVLLDENDSVMEFSPILLELDFHYP